MVKNSAMERWAAVARYEALDALRGLGAIIVLFFHVLTLNSAFGFIVESGIYWLPVRIFFGGHQAVVLFFVLSGFALFLMYESLEKTVPRAAAIFVLSRWVRLYPVYIFSIFLAILIYWLLGREGYEGYPFMDGAAYVDFRLGDKDIWGHLSMVGVFDVLALNAPIWSVVVEMRISIIFPLIYFAVKYAPVGLLVACLTAFLGLASLLYFEVDMKAHEWLATLRYLIFFVFGALLASNIERVARAFSGLPRSQSIGLLVISFAAYAYGYSDWWGWWQAVLGELLVGLGACGLMVASISRPAFFRGLGLAWLGRISFSLYLVHFPCLIAIYAVLGGSLGEPWIGVLGMAVSIAVAMGVWRFVELPALSASRYVRYRAQSSDAAQAHP